MTLPWEELPGLAELFRKVIDFRSRFTATHSSGVASVGAALAKKISLDQQFIDRMRLAGLLHDIGKLVVPAEILIKHTPLTSADFATIRKHPYYSAKILGNLQGFEEISQWSALHHERLDGSGYPYHPLEEDIPEGAKILAVADTFTALTEDRPYRCGMTGGSNDKIMQDMAAHRKLDNHYVAFIHDHSEEFGHICLETQKAADAEHRRFMDECLMTDRSLEPDDYCPGKQPK
jgi:HD-GYP domain-containing protein (c-di-GMP phosphodiesterase class II)